MHDRVAFEREPLHCKNPVFSSDWILNIVFIPLLIHLSTTLPSTTNPPTMSPWKGEVPRVYDLTCDDTVCPPDSFCLSDYESRGSRCHCNLGRRGDTCSEGETVQALVQELHLDSSQFCDWMYAMITFCTFKIHLFNFFLPQLYWWTFPNSMATLIWPLNPWRTLTRHFRSLWSSR